MDHKREVKKMLKFLETYPIKQDVVDIPVVIFEDVDKSFMISRYRNKYVLKDDFVDSGLWRLLTRDPPSVSACSLTEILSFVEEVDPEFTATYRSLVKCLVGSEYTSTKKSYFDFKAVFPDVDDLAEKAEEWEHEDNLKVMEIYFGVNLDSARAPVEDDKPRHLGIVKEDDDES